MSEDKQKAIPEVGKEYHFFDDGKTGRSRRFIVNIIEVIPFSEMKDRKVVKAWKNEVKECFWLYAKTTDYFVKGICSDYDTNALWFVRTLDGRWFSIDYPNCWMGGVLDVDNKIWDRLIADGLL